MTYPLTTCGCTATLVTGFRNKSLYNLPVLNASKASNALILKRKFLQKLKRGLIIVKGEEAELGIDIIVTEKGVKAENSGLKVTLHNDSNNQNGN